MSYDSELTSISREPVTYMVMTLDYCSRTFGASPCNATGIKCYNTFTTCKYKSAYNKSSKDYTFSAAMSHLPFKSNERPYILDVSYLPTEIKDNLTISARVKVKLHDEEDTDVGVDPYLSDRASVQGTFWKKLIARNQNYKGRTIKLYEGFYGNLFAEFQQRFIGVIDNITLQNGYVEIEIKDLLRSLSDIYVPAKVDIKLAVDITGVATQLTVTNTTGLASTGYVRIADEIIYYGAKDDTTKILSSLTRGSFGTTAAEHKAKDKIQPCKYYSPQNPFDLLVSMLSTDAGIDPAYIDTAEFEFWKGWPGGEVNFSALISEPSQLDKLFFEVIDVLDAKTWVGEDLKITIRKNLPNQPGREYATITDGANIVDKSASVDLNQKSRKTRVSVYWDKTAIGKDEEAASYNRLDVAIDADAESVNEYNETIEKVFYCRWLRQGYDTEENMAAYVTHFITAQLLRLRDAQPVLTFSVELKDSGIKTGDFIKVSTDELNQITGEDLDAVNFQVVFREQNDNLIKIKALKMPDKRIAFIAPDGTPDYPSASAAQKEYAFISDNDGLMSNGDPGYYLY
jgi:hypothetical protein